MDSALIDAKVAASEARTDTKFERLMGRLGSIDGKLTRLEADNIRTRATVRTSAFSLFAAMVAVLALIFTAFAQSFNIGAKVAGTARDEARRVPDAQPRTAGGAAVPPSRR